MEDAEKEAKRSLFKGLIQRSKAEAARHQGQWRQLDSLYAHWQLQMDLLKKDVQITAETIRGLQSEMSELDNPNPTAETPATPTETATSSEPGTTTSPTMPSPLAVSTETTTTEVEGYGQPAGEL